MQDPSKLAQVAEPEDPRDEVSALRTKVEDYERWFRTLDNQIRVLEAERQRFAAVVENSDASFVLLDAGSRVTWTNEEFRRQFGLSTAGEQDGLGKSCHEALCRKNARCPG